MSVFLAAALRYLGVTGVVVIAVVVFYEGLPLGPLRHIPLIGPALELVVDGRVDRERKAAREGYVLEARLIAAEAKEAEAQRQLETGRKAAALYAELLAEAQERERADAITEEKRISDYEAKLAAAGRSCLLDADDLDWLRQ